MKKLRRLLNIINRVPCLLGFHSLQFHEQFVRKCPHCETKFAADYFEWRANGNPVWHKLKGPK